MKYMISLASIIAMSVFLSSCNRAEFSLGDMNSSSEVRFELCGVETASKSSITADETAVQDVKIMAYSDGVLAAEGYYTSFDDISLRLDMSKVYDFYALANVGDIESPVYEDDMKEYRYRIDALGDLETAFPMCWSESGISPSRSGVVMVQLTRLVAKVTFRFDDGDTGLVVESVRLCQSPMSVMPFASSGSKADVVSDGDYASEADISYLNKGGRVSFYMLENMQGTLLPGNTDPMNKVPSKVPEDAGMCTYIEVDCKFVFYGREGEATYRMYLGEDNVTNFDVRRNHVISLSLDLTSDGLKIEDSWKVVPDYVQRVSNVIIDKTELTLMVGEQAQLNATVVPDDADDMRVEWQSRKEAVAVVDEEGVVTGMTAGVAAIIVTSVDRPELYDRCVVTVVEPEVASLSFTPSSVTAVLGKDGSAKESYFSVIATYSDGSTAEVTHLCSYSSSSSSAVVSSPGVLSHVSEGKAMIYAELNGVKTSMQAVTEGFAVCGMELQSSSLLIPLGESYVLKYRVLYNDGTVSSWISYGLLSNSDFGAGGWISTDTNVAQVNTYGLVTPVSVGTTTVTINVYGADNVTYSASAVVKVTSARIVRIYAKAPAMFYDGSGGPSLIGVFSDGTESSISADKWTTSSPYVTFTEADGLKISNESMLTEGVTMCKFTATFGNLTASATSTYGKWVRGIKVERQVLAGLSDYSYRLVLIMDDFTEKYVAFSYSASRDGISWETVRSADSGGVELSYVYKHIRFSTASPYYDYTGSRYVWNTEYHGY